MGSQTQSTRVAGENILTPDQFARLELQRTTVIGVLKEPEVGTGVKVQMHISDLQGVDFLTTRQAFVGNTPIDRMLTQIEVDLESAKQVNSKGLIAITPDASGRTVIRVFSTNEALRRNVESTVDQQAAAYTDSKMRVAIGVTVHNGKVTYEVDDLESKFAGSAAERAVENTASKLKIGAEEARELIFSPQARLALFVRVYAQE